MKWIFLSLLSELTNRNYLTMSFGPHFYSKHVSILPLAFQWTKYKNKGKSPTANANLALPKCFQKNTNATQPAHLEMGVAKEEKYVARSCAVANTLNCNQTITMKL